MATRWFAACTLALLAACGQKGSLQLPDARGQAVTTPAITPASATASAAVPATDDAAASSDQSEEENSSRPRQ